jgi:RNA polymerase sigma-32 factor
MSEVTTMQFLVPSSKKLLAINTATIEDYIAYVNSIPMLDETEELECTKRLQQQGDLQAAHRLVVAHLRYVVKVAKKYLGYGLPIADLIQEGTIGLMKAVRKFDPAKNVRLVTFALHWIKAEIHEFILKNWKIVKIATTKAQRKLFFKLKSSKKTFNWLNNQEIKQIATDLKVKPADVRQMEMRIFGKDNNEEVIDFSGLEDIKFNPEIMLEKSEWETKAFTKLNNAILKLDPRSQDILRKRWLQPEKATLEDLALEYNVSKERIRQIEQQAITVIREYF